MTPIFAALALLPLVLSVTMKMDTQRAVLHGSMGLVCLTMLTVPRALWGSTPLDRVRVGVAGAEPRVMTYSVAVLLILAALFLAGHRSFNVRPVLPIAIFLVVWPPLFWVNSGEVQAGIVHLVFALMAWLAGWGVAIATSRVPLAGRVVTGWLAAWMFFEATICGLQYLGSGVFAPTGIIIQDASLAGRAGGTLGHPSAIGKAVFIVMLAALPYLASRDRRTRLLASLTIGLAAIPLMASGGRVNAVATVMVLAIWIASDTDANKWSRRFVLAFGVAGLTALSLPLWIERFRTGEDGTFRARFNQTAIDFLQGHGILGGTGANSYITNVGPTDSMAALGWIVHNLYLLYLVEIGIVGLACFLVPWAYSLRVALRARRSHGVPGAAARALLSWAPGGVLITMTGFGMASDPLMPWFFFLAFAAALASQDAASRSRPSEAKPRIMV